MCCLQKMIALEHKQTNQLGSTFLAISSRGDELILVSSVLEFILREVIGCPFYTS